MGPQFLQDTAFAPAEYATIRSLIVSADPWPGARRSRLASQFFPPNTRTDVPRLETLVILSSYEEPSMRPDGQVEFPVGSIHAPNLRSLVLGAGLAHVPSCMTLDTLRSLESLPVAFPRGLSDSKSHLEQILLAHNLIFLDVTDSQHDFLSELMSPRIPRTQIPDRFMLKPHSTHLMFRLSKV
ncbi:hypothetical protein M422DRAFT_32998 [Sphaerobolus stellatus SS14]|uniref:Uncharacterized protein n=1 Tax=Sphaerobolus stellatus (strain SS14) TaxID=990650 RepID=A0A0C9U7K8_SPHS4|nr:hypothetical protein M422DRAFT_32998 [Sphaerobolus stellatus SS14]